MGLKFVKPAVGLRQILECYSTVTVRIRQNIKLHMTSALKIDKSGAKNVRVAALIRGN